MKTPPTVLMGYVLDPRVSCLACPILGRRQVSEGSLEVHVVWGRCVTRGFFGNLHPIAD
jgi:hypothetical protein